jgi:hypothetical protein
MDPTKHVLYRIDVGIAFIIWIATIKKILFFSWNHRLLQRPGLFSKLSAHPFPSFKHYQRHWWKSERTWTAEQRYLQVFHCSAGIATHAMADSSTVIAMLMPSSLFIIIISLLLCHPIIHIMHHPPFVCASTIQKKKAQESHDAVIQTQKTFSSPLLVHFPVTCYVTLFQIPSYALPDLS